MLAKRLGERLSEELRGAGVETLEELVDELALEFGVVGERAAVADPMGLADELLGEDSAETEATRAAHHLAFGSRVSRVASHGASRWRTPSSRTCMTIGRGRCHRLSMCSTWCACARAIS